MIDDVVDEIRNLRTNLFKTIPLLEQEINNIIHSKITSQQHIERLLDALLDYGYMGVGKEQFMKLNSYYATFNQEYSDKYKEFYEEIEKE